MEEKTIRKTFELPTDKTEEYVLCLYQDGVAVVEPTIIPVGKTSIEVELTGSGVQYYELYINDTYYKTEKVDFGSNG